MTRLCLLAIILLVGTIDATSSTLRGLNSQRVHEVFDSPHFTESNNRIPSSIPDPAHDREHTPNVEEPHHDDCEHEEPVRENLYEEPHHEDRDFHRDQGHSHGPIHKPNVDGSGNHEANHMLVYNPVHHGDHERVLSLDRIETFTVHALSVSAGEADNQDSNSQGDHHNTNQNNNHENNQQNHHSNQQHHTSQDNSHQHQHDHNQHDRNNNQHHDTNYQHEDKNNQHHDNTNDSNNHHERTTQHPSPNSPSTVDPSVPSKLPTYHRPTRMPSNQRPTDTKPTHVPSDQKPTHTRPSRMPSPASSSIPSYPVPSSIPSYAEPSPNPSNPVPSYIPPSTVPSSIPSVVAPSATPSIIAPSLIPSESSSTAPSPIPPSPAPSEFPSATSSATPPVEASPSPPTPPTPPAILYSLACPTALIFGDSFEALPDIPVFAVRVYDTPSTSTPELRAFTTIWPAPPPAIGLPGAQNCPGITILRLDSAEIFGIQLEAADPTVAISATAFQACVDSVAFIATAEALEGPRGIVLQTCTSLFCSDDAILDTADVTLVLAFDESVC